MTRKRKLTNLKGRCRICLVEDGCMSNLFDEPIFTKIKDLMQCTSNKIKDDGIFSSIICHVCLYKLDMWDEFKEQFVRTQTLLSSQLDSVNSSIDVCKRGHSEVADSTEDSLSDNLTKKKVKSDVPSPLLTNPIVDSTTNQSTSKEAYLSEDEIVSSKDSTQRLNEYSSSQLSKDAESKKETVAETKPSLAPINVKPLNTKRGKTIEGRRASTKRWVARKKALLAATGKNVSDTDSAGSDDTQLSPVQKARARNNVDKENMRQKRINRELKKLGATLCEKYTTNNDSENYGWADTDSDTGKAKSQKETNSATASIESKTAADTIQTNEVQENVIPIEETVQEKENISLPTMPSTENHAEEEPFVSQSLKSELEVGNAKYIVTSTLLVADPQYLSDTNLSNLSKELKTVPSEQSSQEKNTDIIDAVQLRRIHPVSNDSNKKGNAERCLNIDVESTELDILKRVQKELACFVETQMKQRLCERNFPHIENRRHNEFPKNAYLTLDQQLKCIVEKTIRKNLEVSFARLSMDDNESNSEDETLRVISPTSVKEAEKLEKYQPKVVLKRLDTAEDETSSQLNSSSMENHANTPSKDSSLLTKVVGKRQSVPPAKYNDFNTSTLDSDGSNLSEELPGYDTPKSTPTYNTSVHRINVQNRLGQADSGVSSSAQTSVMSNTKTTAVSKQQEKDIMENSTKSDLSNCEKHICGVCGKCFNTRNDVAIHFRTHKVDNNTSKHNKHKVMRCKRCHEIVEARFVKSHVCKQIHKCYVCNSTFRTEKLLSRHLDSHDQSEFNIENITKGQSKKSPSTSPAMSSKTHVDPHKGQEYAQNSDSSITLIKASTKIGNCQPEKMACVKSTKVGSQIIMGKSKEAYTCFVCDKMFTDEEELKDHLQKHCDDISEGEQSKEQYQCAICGDSMESEEALEAHVEKHLFDEEDDNPNLISISNDNDKPNGDAYHCLQCAESFNSEMLLEMHMQAHEEEAAIAEWENQGIKSYEYQCMICDELFETEDDLAEHLDIHNANAHVCQLCEKPFTTLEDLQRHVASH